LAVKGTGQLTMNSDLTSDLPVISLVRDGRWIPASLHIADSVVLCLISVRLVHDLSNGVNR
jgi:hypothetical protein